MLEVRFNCMCINECIALGIPCGMTFGGTVHIAEDGDTTFIVDLPTGGPFKCAQMWFANYFKIIE